MILEKYNRTELPRGARWRRAASNLSQEERMNVSPRRGGTIGGSHDRLVVRSGGDVTFRCFAFTCPEPLGRIDHSIGLQTFGFSPFGWEMRNAMGDLSRCAKHLFSSPILSDARRYSSEWLSCGCENKGVTPPPPRPCPPPLFYIGWVGVAW